MASHNGLIYVLGTKDGYVDKNGNMVSDIEEAYQINFNRFGFGPSAFEVYQKLGFLNKNIEPHNIRFHTVIPSYEGRLSIIEKLYKKLGVDIRISTKKAYEDYYCYNLSDNNKYKEYITRLEQQIIDYYKQVKIPERILLKETTIDIYKVDEINSSQHEGKLEEFVIDNGTIYRYSLSLKSPQVEKYFELPKYEQEYFNNWQNQGLIEFVRKTIYENKFNYNLKYEFAILDIKIDNGKMILYSNNISWNYCELIENIIREYYDTREMHITRMFGSYILLQKHNQELKALKATPIPIKYCPLMIQLLKEVGGEVADKIIESLNTSDEELQTKMMCELINEVVIKGGYFDTNRPLNSCEANVLFGASETMSSAFKSNMIDAAVIVSNNLGTIITTNDFSTQGAVKRMTGLFYTSPNKKIVETAKKEGIIPVFPYTAKIDQIEGVKLAIKKGYKRIAVSLAAKDNYLHEKLEQLEKEHNITIYKFGLCSTGIDKDTAEKMQKHADVIWSCASKYVKELIEPNALAQVGIKIPVHIMTNQGWNIVHNHLTYMNKEIEEDIPLNKGEEKRVLLNSHNKIKVLMKKNIHNCTDCPHPCI